VKLDKLILKYILKIQNTKDDDINLEGQQTRGTYATRQKA
jgi:hypothetical protein